MRDKWVEHGRGHSRSSDSAVTVNGHRERREHTNRLSATQSLLKWCDEQHDYWQANGESSLEQVMGVATVTDQCRVWHR